MGSYSVKETRSGHKTLVYTGDRELKLHSAYNPVGESERLVSSFSRGRASVILVAGLALGYHVQGLRKKFPDTLILVLEKDRVVIDIAERENPGCLEGVFVAETINQAMAVLEELDVSEFRGFAVYTHRPSCQIAGELYDRFISEINRFMSSKISDLFTRFEFEERWIRNILANIHHIYTSHRIGTLFGKFRGYPGILVSAGPSLRNNLHLLTGLRDRALVVSVDTALKVLNRKNIAPHMVMTLDAQKHSLKHFLGVPDRGARLLADLVSYPAIARNFTGPKLFSTTSKYYTDSSGALQREATPFMGWLEKHVPPVGDIQSGGSVATSAFDLLLNLGCDPIILLGQDLAYTGREIHCSGTYHNDDWSLLLNRTRNLDTINQGVVRKRKIKRVERYGGGGSVISDFVFDLYRGWFEDSAEKVPVTVINATEGGARIKNCTEESLESLSKRLKKKERAPDDIIAGSLADEAAEPGPAHLAGAIADLVDELKKLVMEIGEQDGNGVEARQEILNRVYDSDLDPVLNPFIRKTTTYIKRRALPPEEGTSILLRDMKEAACNMIPLLQACRERCVALDE